jgi:hypothetical protein
LQIERGDNASITTLHALGFVGPLVLRGTIASAEYSRRDPL